LWIDRRHAPSSLVSGIALFFFSYLLRELFVQKSIRSRLSEKVFAFTLSPSMILGHFDWTVLPQVADALFSESKVFFLDAEDASHPRPTLSPERQTRRR